MKQYYPDLDAMDISASIDRLQLLIDTLPARLQQMPDEVFSHKPSPEKWSPKEIIGHLTDSATNNHQRFIRIQYEEVPVLSYDQDAWVNLTNYTAIDAAEVIRFWELYNRRLLHIIKQIPAANLARKGKLQSGEEMTLAFYINDYVRHMEHHLDDILE